MLAHGFRSFALWSVGFMPFGPEMNLNIQARCGQQRERRGVGKDLMVSPN